MKAEAGTVRPMTVDLACSRAADFLELTKPRITLLVLATTLVGFFLGSGPGISLGLLGHALLGTALVAGGASALNMWSERRLDGLMKRTLHRPLPAGRLQAPDALRFATALAAAGLAYLFYRVNPLTSLLAAATLLSYLFVYTPLKTRTWWCTLIGAVPGAIPPVMGYTAATGSLDTPAWILFGILFFWQIPHFYAIGWIYREDYARAGFPMLPVVDETGRRTAWQAGLHIVALMIMTVLPALAGVAGNLYLGGALLSGACFLAFGTSFARMRSLASARRLFVASVCYLPLLMALLMVDRTPR